MKEHTRDAIVAFNAHPETINVIKNALNDYFKIYEYSDINEFEKRLNNKDEQVQAVIFDCCECDEKEYQLFRWVARAAISRDIIVFVFADSLDEQQENIFYKEGSVEIINRPIKKKKLKKKVLKEINAKKILKQFVDLKYDKTTGLLTLNSFYQEGERWLEENPDCEFDIVAEKIRHMKFIKASYGKKISDDILSVMAENVREAQKQVDFLCARIYEENFLFMFKRTPVYMERLVDNANMVAAKYEDKARLQFKFGVYEIERGNDESISAMSEKAFMALTSAREHLGTDVAYYNSKLHEKNIMEERLCMDLSQGIEDEQFQIYFQPKYCLRTNTIMGAEALVRWFHPTQGLISPGLFIPLFEKNGLIVEIDKYVWNKTAEFISHCQKEGREVVPISVNVSPIDIDEIDVVETLCEIVKRNQITPDNIHLEITESSYVRDTDKIIRIVRQLQNEGFIIEMDDFGSGYSSLNMLAKLPVNILKLDMKFIQSIEDTHNARTIIDFIIGLAKWMKLDVIAEGVENKEQLELLKSLDCDYVQGYLFAKPMPQQEFEAQYLTH